MSAYTSTIRSIERTAHYTPIQRVSRYTAYPYREGEPQMPVNVNRDWMQQYRQAASKGSEWLQLAQEAQATLDRMMIEISRHTKGQRWIETNLPQRLMRLLDDLQHQYNSRSDSIRPEVWAAIELALRHPAVKRLNLFAAGTSEEQHRNIHPKSEQPFIRNTSCDERDVKRLLLGADGFLNTLKHALSYGEQHKAIDLLQLPFPAAYPYAMYYGAMQTYWPLPVRGILLNKYY